MNRSFRRLFTIIVSVLVLCVFCCGWVSAQGASDLRQSEATVISKLQVAGSEVKDAFVAVLRADEEGVDVVTLLSQLIAACDFLEQAENAYRSGYLNSAATKAEQVTPIAHDIILEAQNLKEASTASTRNAFWFVTAASVFGIFNLLLGLFLVWRRFRRNYIKNISDNKPEVNPS